MFPWPHLTIRSVLPQPGCAHRAERRVLVTAGASGIGRVLALARADAGWHARVTGTDAAALAGCPPEWRKRCVDVSGAAAMTALFDTIRQDWAGLETPCANAGITGETALLENRDIPGFRRCMEVNRIGAVLAVQGALPMMKIARSGCVLFMGSTSGVFGPPDRAPCVASKWAINGLMKTVAMKAGP